MSWENNAPIYGRLPGESEAYRKGEDNAEEPVAQWLTTPWDALLCETRDKVNSFYQDFLNPLTAKPEHLDWLSGLCGYTSEYSLVEYPEAIKRQLIARAFDYVWINKGTKNLLEYLIIQSFQVDAEIYLLGNFIADVSVVGDTLGGEAFEYYIRLPLKYLRTSKTWQLTERLNRLYGPIYCHSQVLYDRFYAGFSAAGELIFTEKLGLKPRPYRATF